MVREDTNHDDTNHNDTNLNDTSHNERNHDDRNHNDGENAVHGSDSDENAAIKGDFFFSKLEQF